MMHMPSYIRAASVGIWLTRLILFSKHVNKSDFADLKTFSVGVARDHATGPNEYLKKSFILTSRFSQITSNHKNKSRSARTTTSVFYRNVFLRQDASEGLQLVLFDCFVETSIITFNPFLCKSFCLKLSNLFCS